MAGVEFQKGEIAVLNGGLWRDHEVEIVDTLAPRVIMIIRDTRVEKETYTVLMPNGEIWPVAPEFLRKRVWRSANADVMSHVESFK